MLYNKSIMIVDDSKVDILLIQNVFEELDITNETVIKYDGYDAIEYLKSLENKDDYPGLILLDINMPKMNGIEFLNTLKNDDNLKIIPVIMLTTSDSTKDKEQSYQNSVAGYLVKPIEYYDFLEMIKSLKGFWDTSKISH